MRENEILEMLENLRDGGHACQCQYKLIPPNPLELVRKCLLCQAIDELNPENTCCCICACPRCEFHNGAWAPSNTP
jgi:hypothetical protein